MHSLVADVYSVWWTLSGTGDRVIFTRDLTFLTGAEGGLQPQGLLGKMFHDSFPITWSLYGRVRTCFFSGCAKGWICLWNHCSALPVRKYLASVDSNIPSWSSSNLPTSMEHKGRDTKKLRTRQLKLQISGAYIKGIVLRGQCNIM